jgi:hypothetical protein
MNSQKAIKIIDYTIERKIELQKGFTDPSKPWNYGGVNLSQFSEQLSRMFGDDVKILELIRAQISTKCTHPKNMRDICNGVEYCMDCNSDI